MRDISATLKRVYGASAVVVIPGGDTFDMGVIAPAITLLKATRSGMAALGKRLNRRG